MKQIITLLLCLLTVIPAMAATETTFTGVLTSTVESSTSTVRDQEVVLTDNGDDTYKLTIKSLTCKGFKLGDVELTKIAASAQEDGTIKLVSAESEIIKYKPTIFKTYQIPVMLNEAIISANGNRLTITDLSVQNVPDGMFLTGRVNASVTFNTAYTTDYVGDLVVTVKGAPATTSGQVVTVTNNGDGTFALSITGFKYGNIPLGDIVLSKVTGETQEDGSIALTDEETITINLLGTHDVDVKLNEATISANGNNLIIKDLQIDNAPFVGNVSVTYNLPDVDPETPPTILPSVPSSSNSYEIYSLSGHKLNTLGHGINIIRYSNGETKKVLVK